MNFECRIPNVEDMKIRWDYLISINEEDRVNWEEWKKTAINNFITGKTIPYYGYLDGKMICEATVVIKEGVTKLNNLVGDNLVYLSAFRTDKEYEGQGYFSKLYHYMINDLKEKGYKEATLGVEPTELRNKAIYEHYGFTDYFDSLEEIYPNGDKIKVDYYKRKL